MKHKGFDRNGNPITMTVPPKETETPGTELALLEILSQFVGMNVDDLSRAERNTIRIASKALNRRQNLNEFDEIKEFTLIR